MTYRLISYRLISYRLISYKDVRLKAQTRASAHQPRICPLLCCAKDANVQCDHHSFSEQNIIFFFFLKETSSKTKNNTLLSKTKRTKLMALCLTNLGWLSA